MLDVRPYSVEDEAVCLDIFDSNIPGYFAAHERADYQGHLRDPRGSYYVALEAGQVCGCGGYIVHENGIASLGWGMVHADRHRCGLGSELLRFRLEQIKSVPYAWCVVLDTSQHAAGFFVKFGFETIRVVPNGYGDGLDKHYMRLLWNMERQG